MNIDIEPKPGTRAFNEADSNADTCCLGTNFTILSYTYRTADVFPYDDSYAPITNVPIVSGATKYINPDTGEQFILIFHESLYYGTKLHHSLINPNQIRYFGIDVWDNPYDRAHDLSIDIDRGPIIPLKFQGTKLSFESEAPSAHDLATLPHIDMTSKREWNPQSVKLGEVATISNTKNKNTYNVISSITYEPSTPAATAYSQVNEFEQYDENAIMYDISPVHVCLKELLTTKHEENDFEMDDLPARRTFVSTERHKKATAMTIAENWGIGPLRAKATLEATTQRGTRSAILPLSRRYKADRYYNVKRLNIKMATDTMYADTISINQHKYSQTYSAKCGFAATFPMDSINGDSIGYSLKTFISEFGAMEHLTFDGAMAQTGSKTLFMNTIRENDIKYHVSQPYRPNENPAESAIREIKRRWYRIMMKKNVPKRLWDFGFVWVCDTGNMTVSSSRYAKGRTPLEIVTGETPEISEYIDFGFYDWVVYKENAGLGETKLGRWIGVSHKVGPLNSYWILPISGIAISCTTVQRLTNLEQQQDHWKKKMKQYDDAIEERLNIRNPFLNLSDIPRWNQLTIDAIDEEFMEDFNKVIGDPSVKHANDDLPKEEQIDQFDDWYVHMELGMPRGADGDLERATVKRRAIDVDGKPIGVAHKNPFLDTRQYEVEYLDGTIEIVPANLIAENLLAQVDEEGHRQLLLDEIIDHRKTKDAIDIKDGFIINETTGHKRKKMTTKGWEICVQWKDGSSTWVELKDLKNSYPVELAQYAINNKLVDEPAFAWWVPYTMKKAKLIISKIKSKYWERTHKYGIRVPKSVDEALEIDKQEGNNYWRDAINEEMKKIKEAFKLYKGDPSTLVGYQEITTHIIFDIKLAEGFRRKARLVADGHKTATPASMTYSSVVSRDSVRICLLLAALNDLDIQSADIENAYLTAPCREKCWTRGGSEFGAQKGEVFLIERALYGLKSSGAAFRAFLAQTLDKMGFQPSQADQDVWMRPATKPNGEEYYEYILCYVDDILAISLNATDVLKEVQKDFKLKKDEIKTPDIYLGGKLEKKLLNGRNVWTQSSLDYTKAAIENIEKQAISKGYKLPSKVSTPMSAESCPELDQTAELEPDNITFFQEIIGILRWLIELGRVDILTEVAMLSSYQASPREGHLNDALHIVAFLKKRPKLTIYFNPELPKLDYNIFNNTDPEMFREQYRDAKEELPPRMPKPRGKPVTMTAFVDASHAADKKTRRSHTGFIIFVNRAPIIWYSKKQSTIESSTFSSEFIAMKTCMESIVSLRYKLRMFGVPLEDVTHVLCDNQSVVDNSSKIDSTLNKKHVSIAYHAVRWSVAAEIMRVGKIDGEFNLADAMTKRLPAPRRDFLFGEWTY